MHIGLRVKRPLFLSDFTETWTFSIDFFPKYTQISNFMKIRPVGAELFHADRHDEAKIRICNWKQLKQTRSATIRIYDLCTPYQDANPRAMLHYVAGF